MSKKMCTWLSSQRNEIYIDDYPFTYSQKYDDSLYNNDGDIDDICKENYIYDTNDTDDTDTNLYECNLLFKQMVDMANDMDMDINIPDVDENGMITETTCKKIFNKKMKESFYEFIKNNSL